MSSDFLSNDRPPAVAFEQDYPGCIRLACPACNKPLRFATAEVNVNAGQSGGDPIRVSYTGPCGCVRVVECSPGSLVYIRAEAECGGVPPKR